MAKRKYKPRTEAQKARRRELYRLKKEATNKKLVCVKKALKNGGKITPKNAEKIVKKAIKAASLTKPKKNKKVAVCDKIRINTKHVIVKGDLLIFKDFTPNSMFDIGRKLIEIAFLSAMKQGLFVKA